MFWLMEYLGISGKYNCSYDTYVVDCWDQVMFTPWCVMTNDNETFLMHLLEVNMYIMYVIDKY